MKVKELIEKLKEMPQDVEVEIIVPDSYGNHSSFPEYVEFDRRDGCVQII